MSKTSELSTKLIREIEDMVEDAFPNHLHEQDFIFTRLHSNIKARLFHETNHGKIEVEKKIIPMKKSRSN